MPRAEATLVKSTVIVYDEKDASRLHNKGKFGDYKEGKLYLSLIETLFLLEKNKIEVVDYRKKKLKFKNLVKRVSKSESNFWIRYVVYRDIRSKGYVTKTALKYGADFRIYDKKKSSAHAPWLLFAVKEGEEFNWRGFAAMNRVAHSVRKKLMIGIVDDEEDVIYYEIGWKKP